ncbi:related to THO complex subunit 3 [Sporisorium reilianum SRZ2]|uniref:Related to THO complex subunit 3 n=1 Tax=Sporisorium reilianum (strain SRZ2) TaxID=999809 RepID=E7A113_SPORE|nr:related to THO complex subunit 3 [Sporisorium reilianum SRZ2]
MSLSLHTPPPGSSSSKTSSTLATSFRDRNIALPNFATLKTKELRSGHRQSVRGLGWSIDGRKLATCGADRSIRVWVPERSVDHRASTELRGHAESVDQLVWHPLQPEVLASASADRTVRVWDARVQPAAVSVVSTPGANINIAYHPTGNYVAVGDKTDTVSVVDTRQNRIVHTVCTRRSAPAGGEAYSATTVLGSHDEINELAFSPDGSLLLLSSGSGAVHIHTTSTYQRIHLHPAHTANVFCLEYDPLSRFVATASSDAMLSLWHATEWHSLKMVTSLAFPARAIGFSFDGELLAAAGEDAFISINATNPALALGADDSDQLHRLPLGAGTMINTLAWHPSKYVLAYAGDEAPKDAGVVRVFNL